MNTNERRRLDVAARVRDFSFKHPDTDNPGHIATVKELADGIAHVESLANQELSGHGTVSGAVVGRAQLRKDIADAMAVLGGLAAPTSPERPELIAGLLRPRRNVSDQQFLARARVAAATALTHREVLAGLGMPATHPEDLAALVDRFESVLTDRNAGRTAHVGARADLNAVTVDLMRLVQRLDALNKFRFRNTPEQLAAWKSARNASWPNDKAAPAAPQQAGAQPGA